MWHIQEFSQESVSKFSWSDILSQAEAKMPVFSCCLKGSMLGIRQCTKAYSVLETRYGYFIAFPLFFSNYFFVSVMKSRHVRHFYNCKPLQMELKNL